MLLLETRAQALSLLATVSQRGKTKDLCSGSVTYEMAGGPTASHWKHGGDAAASHQDGTRRGREGAERGEEGSPDLWQALRAAMCGHEKVQSALAAALLGGKGSRRHATKQTQALSVSAAWPRPPAAPLPQRKTISSH